MIRSSLAAISFLLLFGASFVTASPNSGFVANFNKPHDFLGRLGDADISSEGGLADGKGQTTGYLRLGQSGEATQGGIAFDNSRLDDANADLFRLRLTIQGPMDTTEQSGMSVSLTTSQDPATMSLQDENTSWLEQLDATSMAGTSIPLLTTHTGVSVGLALTTNGAEDAANRARPCSGHIGECLSINLRLDGELIATAEQPVGDELWKEVTITAVATSLLGLSSVVTIAEDTVGELLTTEVPILKGISSVVVASDSLPESIGYGIDDLSLIYGRSFPNAGDFNEDGLIDLADFLTLIASMNTSPATYELGDFNFDDRIDIEDFVGFRQSWFQTRGEIGVVPEPAASTLIGMSALLLLTLRQRQ